MAEMEPPVTKRSSRDPERLCAGLEAWLASQFPEGASPRVSGIRSPESTGMSSETLLFDASWQENGVEEKGGFVARLVPDPGDVPVFQDYDLALQFRVMKLVREHTAVPVPRPRWLELDPNVLGTGFFVMDRVEGRVPPDVMPYNMDSWLLQATPDQQRELERSTVETLVELHSMDLASADVSFLELDVPGDTPLRRHVEHWRRYYDWARGERRHEVLDRAFSWLEDHWPQEEGPTVVSWGDSRIGNVLYDGFKPTAVLDWEMAGLAPREVDIAWMVFLHAFFENIARQAGLPGMPDFMQRDRIPELYSVASGYSVRDFRFYEMYAAIRHGIVMARVHARRVHFGEAEWTDDDDAPILHRNLIESMLDGSYWA